MLFPPFPKYLIEPLICGIMMRNGLMMHNGHNIIHATDKILTCLIIIFDFTTNSNTININ